MFADAPTAGPLSADRHLGKRVEALDQRIVVTLEPRARINLSVGPHQAILGQVLARRERTSLPGQNDAADRGVALGR